MRKRWYFPRQLNVWWELALINQPLRPNSFKSIPKLIQKNFNADVGTIMALSGTSNYGGIYQKHFKCECTYNELIQGVWFIYIRPEGMEAPAEPSQESACEYVYANVFNCYKVERWMLGHVIMTITPPKEKQRKHLPTMECQKSHIFLVFIIEALKMQPIYLD